MQPGLNQTVNPTPSNTSPHQFCEKGAHQLSDLLYLMDLNIHKLISLHNNFSFKGVLFFATIWVEGIAIELNKLAHHTVDDIKHAIGHFGLFSEQQSQATINDLPAQVSRTINSRA